MIFGSIKTPKRISEKSASQRSFFYTGSSRSMEQQQYWPAVTRPRFIGNYPCYFTALSLTLRLVLKAHSAFDEFEIEFVKLKDGIHNFEFELQKKFFEAFENTEVLEADVQVKVELEKRPHWMTLIIDTTGTMSYSCDRCLEALKLPVEAQYTMVYKQKLDASQKSEDTELILLEAADFTINIAQPIYETTLLALPMLKNCDTLEDKPCNPEMLKKLNEINHGGEEISDPRWDKLKDLLK